MPRGRWTNSRELNPKSATPASIQAHLCFMLRSIAKNGESAPIGKFGSRAAGRTAFCATIHGFNPLPAILSPAVSESVTSKPVSITLQGRGQVLAKEAHRAPAAREGE